MSGPGHEHSALDSFGFREWVVITVPKEPVKFMLKARAWGAPASGNVENSLQMFLTTSQSPEGSAI